MSQRLTKLLVMQNNRQPLFNRNRQLAIGVTIGKVKKCAIGTKIDQLSAPASTFGFAIGKSVPSVYH